MAKVFRTRTYAGIDIIDCIANIAYDTFHYRMIDDYAGAELADVCFERCVKAYKLDGAAIIDSDGRERPITDYMDEYRALFATIGQRQKEHTSLDVYYASRFMDALTKNDPAPPDYYTERVDIRGFAAAHGLSLADVARLCGVTRPTVTGWVKEWGHLSPKTRSKVSSALNTIKNTASNAAYAIEMALMFDAESDVEETMRVFGLPEKAVRAIFYRVYHEWA